MTSSGQVNWRIRHDFQGWTETVEKRLMHEERRPPAPAPGNTYVEGIGQFSVEVLDWCDDIVKGTGFWFSGPGALNAPDCVPPKTTSSYYWMGRTQGVDDGLGYGLQWLTQYRPATGSIADPLSTTTYMRRFYDPGAPAVQTAFSPWSAEDGNLVGTIIMWPRATAPVGYLYLDGSVYDPVLYPMLYAVLGTTYGGTAAAPLLPDMRSRFPIGSGSFSVVGGNEGLAEGSRTTQHTHGVGTLAGGTTGSGHTHDAGTLAGTVSNDRAVGSAARLANPITGDTGTTGSVHTHNVTGATGNVSGGANQNVPFIGVKFCIKAI